MVSIPTITFSQVSALPKAHSHNDYEHERPLFDALDNGFCSVEADIFLVNGELLVGHTCDKLQSEMTLESLYLKPLLERYRKYNGKIFPNVSDFYLWIDLKKDGREIYPKLKELLTRYDEMITSFDGDTKISDGILIILSGDRPVELVLQEKGRRYVTMDGLITDLDSDMSSNFIPVISANWNALFTWRGEGIMPEEQKKVMKTHIQKAHQGGRKIRYWGIPDNKIFWEFCNQNGIDFLNTDHLSELRKFLLP
jgi:hypothetical protein